MFWNVKCLATSSIVRCILALFWKVNILFKLDFSCACVSLKCSFCIRNLRGIKFLCYEHVMLECSAVFLDLTLNHSPSSHFLIHWQFPLPRQISYLLVWSYHIFFTENILCIPDILPDVVMLLLAITPKCGSSLITLVVQALYCEEITEQLSFMYILTAMHFLFLSKCYLKIWL